MIIVDEQLPIVARVLGQYADVVCVDGRAINRALQERMQATSLFIRTVTHVDHTMIAETDLRFIASASAGIDHVDDDVLCSSKVNVVHAPGCNAHAVSEYVMTWLSHVNIPAGATLGIVGFGHVGSRLARLALASGLRVIVNDPPLTDLGYIFPSVVTPMDLESLLQYSDVVTLHVPYTESGSHPTKGLMNTERLARIKSGATLINTSRGGIVDERSLTAHGTSNRLRAILDVFDNEPDVHELTIQAVPFCTPHIAGYTLQAKANASRIVLEAFRQWSGLDITVPEMSELVVHHRTIEQDIAVITRHPFREQWLADPSADTFSTCRRLTPLRSEHLRPPSWEELHVVHD